MLHNEMGFREQKKKLREKKKINLINNHKVCKQNQNHSERGCHDHNYDYIYRFLSTQLN